MKATFVQIIKNQIKKKELLKQSQSYMARKSQIC
jgi:hypothetical protein